MKALFYRTAKNKPGDRLQSLIETQVPKDKLEVCKSLRSFTQSAKRHPREACIGVLLAESKNDLADLISHRHLLSNLRIVLVVPNKDDDTLAMANQLRPRLLNFLGGDMRRLANALGQMFTQT